MPLAVCACLLLAPALGVPSSDRDERIVGTYYFYWYDWNSSLHFFVGGKDALTNHPPEIEEVSYLSEEWHRDELLDMMDAGIDFLLPVYWGDSYALPWSGIGLERLVDAEEGMVARGIRPPKIGMFYDTTSLMLEHRYRGMPGERPNLSTEYGKDLFYSMIRDFYLRIPEALWARMDSAAVVWLYSSAWVSDYDQSLVEYTRRRFLEDFNSSVFIVRERSWSLDTDMEYGWGAALGPSLLDVTAIGPGFDNEGAVRCYGQQPLKRDRLDGCSYRDDWEEALRAASNIVVIETWNELHEGTEICETVELGRKYIEITAEYARAFKEGSWENLKEIDSEFSLDPMRLEGGPAEAMAINITVINRGWRSWPEYLDLGFLFLGIDSSERTSRTIHLDFPHRLSRGERYSEIVDLGLPGVEGEYRVLVSTSYLNRRLELTAVVLEAPAAVFLISGFVLWTLMIRRRLYHHVSTTALSR